MMNHSMDRRTFLLTSAAATAAATAPVRAASTPRKIKKSLKLGMVTDVDANKKKLSIRERLQIVKDAGFAAVEPDTMFDQKEVEEITRAAEQVGVRLDAIICSKHWSKPLSDPDPAVARECVEAMKVSLKNAKDMGGDMVLLVPAVVKPTVMYKDAYARTIPYIKELAGAAEEMKITIGLENVWNKFLLSPLEFRQYLEEIGSPYVKAWFDVGNIVLYGYPQDWIRTLREQIARIDVKDFKSDKFQFVPLLDGSVNWKEVMTAFDEIGYEGYMAAEVQGGDLAYLTDMVSKRMDKIIAM